MRTLTVRTLLLSCLLALATAPAHGAIAFVNKVVCSNTTICTTTWNVTAGNVIVVGHYANGGSPSFSDDKGSVYVVIVGNGTYAASTQVTGAVLTSGGSTLKVTFAGTEPTITLAEFSGVSMEAAATGVGWTGGNASNCTPGSVVVTGNALLLSIWSNGAGAQSSCTTTTGINLSTLCGGANTGKMNYQIVGPGTYSQTFTFNPGYNAGNAACALGALKEASAAVVKFKHTVISGE